jgi:hypothetical protein
MRPLLEVGDQCGGSGRVAAREQRIGVILAGAQHSAQKHASSIGSMVVSSTVCGSRPCARLK